MSRVVSVQANGDGVMRQPQAWTLQGYICKAESYRWARADEELLTEEEIVGLLLKIRESVDGDSVPQTPSSLQERAKAAVAKINKSVILKGPFVRALL